MKLFNSAPLFLLLLLVFVFDTRAQAAAPGLDEQMQSQLSELLEAIDADDALHRLRSTVDFAVIARGVLGKHRGVVADAQRDRFQQEFEQSMLTLLRSATSSVGDFSVSINRTRISPKNDKRAAVDAVVTTGDNQKLELVAAMALTDAGWQMRNLVFGGVNLGRTYRNQFDQLMQQHGGDVELVIDAWAAQTAKTEVNTSSGS